jgi:hypothetical protein
MIKTGPSRNHTLASETWRRPYKTPVLARRERLSQVTAGSKTASGVSTDSQNP